MRFSYYFNKSRLAGLLTRYFSLKDDMEEEQQILDTIRKGADFKGVSLWVLVFAIFIACIGLSINSTPIIIGAMLISPLMGPILGMGTAVGISDVQLMKRSAKNLGTATLFSILAAAAYFLLSPMDTVRSEQLSRTSPTIYDVLVAVAGGFAAMLATSTRVRSRVIIGVTLSTALMPPLCIVGYGLADARWLVAAGAFYLYFINVVFISIAAYVGVHLLHFRRVEYSSPQHERRVRRTLWITVVVTVAPALLLTYNIARRSLYTQRAEKFVAAELTRQGSEIVEQNIDFEERSIEVVIIGSELSQGEIERARASLPQYGLPHSTLRVIQGDTTGSAGGNDSSADSPAYRRCDELMRENDSLRRALLQRRSPHTEIPPPGGAKE